MEFCELARGIWQNFLQKTVGPNDDLGVQPTSHSLASLRLSDCCCCSYNNAISGFPLILL